MVRMLSGPAIAMDVSIDVVGFVAGSRTHVRESGRGAPADSFSFARLRVVRSGSEAAKEVKSWVPRMWVAISCRISRLRGRRHAQTYGASMGEQMRSSLPQGRMRYS